MTGSGNSANTNTQGQQQGQGQSQSANNHQGQSQTSSNHNTNTANGGSVSNAGNSSATASNQGNNAAQSMTVGGDTYEAPRIPVATAYAAPLAASNGTCMGSSSAGFQGLSFGVSVGSTWKDDGCNRRYNAQALSMAGQSKAAVALLCQDPEISAAMRSAGTPCN